MGEHPDGAGLRGRFRAQVRDDVKRLALRQLAESGPQALSLNAIAKELGVSGPALYRYFANRDSLLTDLVIDAYRDLAAALEAATASREDPAARLVALVHAYRAWAVAEPHRYRLLFRAPLPGYDAQSEQLVHASQLAMNVAAGVMSDLTRTAPHPVPGPLGPQLEQWAERRGLAGVTATAALQATTLWARLHGWVTLEIEGNFASMGLDPAPQYDAEADAVIRPFTV
ncbi:TetR/AcrR family transcriptional regulator [Sphaerisporangium sp. NPDC049002]|uniref:TetR/AcrR family transcriptional regulator n=1 Tax=unclassified Sphaerisporangium TaxID=2630420 RepID=UPI0033E057B0